MAQNNVDIGCIVFPSYSFVFQCFTVAKRTLEGQDMIYQSMKLTNGEWIPLEYKYHQLFESRNLGPDGNQTRP